MDNVDVGSYQGGKVSYGAAEYGAASPTVKRVIYCMHGLPSSRCCGILDNTRPLPSVDSPYGTYTSCYLSFSSHYLTRLLRANSVMFAYCWYSSDTAHFFLCCEAETRMFGRNWLIFNTYACCKVYVFDLITRSESCNIL